MVTVTTRAAYLTEPGYNHVSLRPSPRADQADDEKRAHRRCARPKRLTVRPRLSSLALRRPARAALDQSRSRATHRDVYECATHHPWQVYACLSRILTGPRSHSLASHSHALSLPHVSVRPLARSAMSLTTTTITTVRGRARIDQTTKTTSTFLPDGEPTNQLGGRTTASPMARATSARYEMHGRCTVSARAGPRS